MLPLPPAMWLSPKLSRVFCWSPLCASGKRTCQEYEFPHRQQYRVMWNPSGSVAKKQNTEIIEMGSFEHVPLAHMLSFGLF